jgi:hypothetical protein
MWGVPHCPYHHPYSYAPPAPPWYQYQRNRHSPYAYYPPNPHPNYPHYSNHGRYYGHEGYNTNNSYSNNNMHINNYDATQNHGGSKNQQSYENFNYYSQQYLPNTTEELTINELGIFLIDSNTFLSSFHSLIFLNPFLIPTKCNSPHFYLVD